jgi:hypothetical protein
MNVSGNVSQVKATSIVDISKRLDDIAINLRKSNGTLSVRSPQLIAWHDLNTIGITSASVYKTQDFSKKLATIKTLIRQKTASGVMKLHLTHAKKAVHSMLQQKPLDQVSFFWFSKGILDAYGGKDGLVDRRIQQKKSAFFKKHILTTFKPVMDSLRVSHASKQAVYEGLFAIAKKIDHSKKNTQAMKILKRRISYDYSSVSPNQLLSYDVRPPIASVSPAQIIFNKLKKSILENTKIDSEKNQGNRAAG